VVHQRELIVVAAISSTIAVGLIWPWLTLQPLRAKISFEHDRYREGQAVRVRLVVNSWSPIAGKGIALTGLVAGRPIAVGSIRPFARTEVQISVVPTRRGEFPPGNVMLSCGLPFGLWHPVKAVRITGHILIWPGHVDVNLPLERSGSLSRAENSIAAFAASADSPSGVRPYRRGDLVKLIHHAQTARHDRLIVRELCKPAQPAVTIILDSRDQAYEAAPDLFDQAVRIAAGLYDKCRATGVDADLVVEGAESGRRALKSKRDWLDRLARITTSTSAERSLFKSCRTPTARLVVITTTTGQRMFEALAGTNRIDFILADGPGSLVRSTASCQTDFSFNRFAMA
jgi:uncharacterized protein (DUF58 family)